MAASLGGDLPGLRLPSRTVRQPRVRSGVRLRPSTFRGLLSAPSGEERDLPSNWRRERPGVCVAIDQAATAEPTSAASEFRRGWPIVLAAAYGTAVGASGVLSY